MAIPIKESNKIYDLEIAKEKAQQFCAYRERSQKEVKEKLESYGLIPQVVDEIVMGLIQNNFLNEERYARAYVRGKFRIKKWGRNKIKQGLYFHKLSEYVLKKAFQEIDDEEYIKTLNQLMEKKSKLLKEKNPYLKNRKIAHWLISRGYENDLVWDAINKPSE